MSSLFISHASADAAAAGAAARRLEAWGYRSLFLDFDPDHGIAAGTDWEAQLYRHLKLSRAIVALVTDSFVASHWCFAEVVQARAMGKPVFPLKIAPCSPPAVLGDVQIVDLTFNEAEGWERLRRGLEAAGLSEDFPFDAARPYPGLTAFDAADAGVFNGREEEQTALIETLERMKRHGEPRLALVLGASGSGKSSLVRAGVLPRLGKDSRRWLVIPPWRPGDAPARELARAFAEAFDTGTRRWRDIAAALDADPTGRAWTALADDLREAKGQRDASVLLVLDQLEELFTRSAGEAAAAAASFRAQLRAALGAPGSPLCVLATLRSDFLDSFQVAPELRGLAFETVPLGPMPVERLPRVITGPAARAGVELEDGLVERLVADTGTGEALPLLAFTLRQLWERRQNDRLTVALYERELGSIEGAVATIAESIVAADLGSLDEQALRSAFLRLARLDDGGRLARRRAAWEEVPERARPVVERFVDERLLVSHTLDGGRHVEAAHEALFRAWRRLALWLEEERGLLHFRQRLDRARAEWVRVDRAEEALLQGPALAEAERWRDTRPDDLTADERLFVTASTARRQREIDVIRRRRRLVVTGLASGLVIALILSGLATWQWRTAEQQRRIAVAGQLASQADARLDGTGEGLQQSLLLAAESLRSAWTPEGYAAWARAVALAPRRPEAWIDVGGAAVVALESHPAQPWVAFAGSDGGVRIVDLNSRATLRTLRLVNRPLDPPGHWPGAAVRFSPDGNWLAAAGGRRIAIWNTRTWEGWDGQANTEGFFNMAFDRTSERLAFSGYAQPLRILGVPSKRDLVPAERPGTMRFSAVAFTGPRLITATRTGEVVLWQVDVPDAAPARVGQIDVAGGGIHTLAIGSTRPLLAVSTERTGLRLWSDEAVARALKMDTPEPPAPTQDTVPGVPARELDEDRGSWRVQTPAPHVVAFGPGDEHVLTSAATEGSRVDTYDRAIRLWSVSTGEELARIHPGGPAAFAARGLSLVAGGPQPAVWPLPRRGSADSLSHPTAVQSVAFSPDGRWLAAGLTDGTLVVRRTGSWSDPVTLQVGGPVKGLGFTPDSRWLVAQGGEYSTAALNLVQTGTWKVAASRPHEADFTVRVSPDSRFLLTHTPAGQDRYKGLTRASRSRLWEIATGAETAWRSHEDEDRPMNGKVSIADGTLPLGRQGDMTVLDQAKQWPELRPESREAGGMNDAVPSPDGRWLAGYGGRGASQGLALLEPATGRRLVLLRPARSLVADIAFSRDGRWLATAEGTSLDIWLLGPVETLIGEACTRLSRNLTADEWRMFGSGTPPVTCERLRVPPAPTEGTAVNGRPLRP